MGADFGGIAGCADRQRGRARGGAALRKPDVRAPFSTTSCSTAASRATRFELMSAHRAGWFGLSFQRVGHGGDRPGARLPVRSSRQRLKSRAQLANSQALSGHRLGQRRARSRRVRTAKVTGDFTVDKRALSSYSARTPPRWPTLAGPADKGAPPPPPSQQRRERCPARIALDVKVQARTTRSSCRGPGADESEWRASVRVARARSTTPETDAAPPTSCAAPTPSRARASTSRAGHVALGR